ncbi:MAG: chemotaxis protein CheX [Acidobacteriota bacterium]|nr:chemotaxis protein CheX [Acidobacteriota bacterium]
MIDQNILIRSVTEATVEVFSMMLDMKVEFQGALTESKASEHGIVSLVGITGEWSGSGGFSCSPALASVICARMLGGSLDSSRPVVDDEVLDVVAEVTNMMIGNVKNGLEATTGPLAISVPTVIYGRNFRFRNMSGLPGASLIFGTGDGREDEKFEVRIALGRVSGHSSARLRICAPGVARE